MRDPIRTNNKERKSQTVTIPCPTGGWNKRDALSAMAPTDAVTMDNWLPKQSSIELREGYSFCADTPADNPAQSLMGYNSGGQRTLLYGAGDSIFKMDIIDKTTQLLKDGFGSSLWNKTQYKQRLFLVNGADEPQVYDGQSISRHTFTTAETNLDGTAFDFSRLSDITLFKNRLFFIERESLRFWFSALAGNIGGEIKSFDLSQIAKRGGTLAAIGSCSQNGSGGQDNLFVAITTEGETFLYSGDDPTNMDKWSLKGSYVIPQVLGKRNTENIGGNLIVITKNGYFSLESLIAVQFASMAGAISDKINQAVEELSNAFGYPQWQIKYINSKDMLLINAPINNVSAHQHILNLNTKAWCRFTGIDAFCWEVIDDDIYFAGITGGIYKMFDGNNDSGKEIKGYVQQAYNDFGTSQIKAFKQAKFIVGASEVPYLGISFSVDFKESPARHVSSLTTGKAKWNISPWDTDEWAISKNTRIMTVSISAYPGYMGSIGMTTQSIAADLNWYATAITFEASR